jgi:hypothetical protein
MFPGILFHRSKGICIFTLKDDFHNCMILLNTKLNPSGVPGIVSHSASGSTGGYSNSSPPDLMLKKP